MRIGYTPGQMQAMDEVRAEQVRLEQRALSRRSMLGLTVGLITGTSLGFVVAGSEESKSKPASSPRNLGKEIDSTLRWALDLVATESPVEIERNFEVFRMVVETHPKSEPRLWFGVKLLTVAILDDGLVLSTQRRAILCRSIADLYSVHGHSDSSEEHALEAGLRRLIR